MDNDEDHNIIISHLPIVVSKRAITGKSIYDHNPYVKSQVPTDISSEEVRDVIRMEAYEGNPDSRYQNGKYFNDGPDDNHHGVQTLLDNNPNTKTKRYKDARMVGLHGMKTKDIMNSESFRDTLNIPKHILSFNEDKRIEGSYSGHQVGLLDANSLKTTIDLANDEILDKIDAFSNDYSRELDEKNMNKIPDLNGYWDSDLEDEYKYDTPMINKRVTNLDFKVPFHEATDRGEYGDIERFTQSPSSADDKYVTGSSGVQLGTQGNRDKLKKKVRFDEDNLGRNSTIQVR